MLKKKNENSIVLIMFASCSREEGEQVKFFLSEP